MRSGHCSERSKGRTAGCHAGSEDPASGVFEMPTPGLKTRPSGVFEMPTPGLKTRPSGVFEMPSVVTPGSRPPAS